VGPGLAGPLGEIEQPVGIVEQKLPRGREVQLLAVADEQLDPELALELAHARGDVGLHAVELFGGTGDAAGLHHGAEDLEVAQVHRSHSEMLSIIIIHFTRYRGLSKPLRNNPDLTGPDLTESAMRARDDFYFLR